MKLTLMPPLSRQGALLPDRTYAPPVNPPPEWVERLEALLTFDRDWIVHPENAVPVRTQLGEAWRPVEAAGEWTMTDGALQYGDGEPAALFAQATILDEKVRAYEGGYVAIVTPTGTFEVGRMETGA